MRHLQAANTRHVGDLDPAVSLHTCQGFINMYFAEEDPSTWKEAFHLSTLSDRYGS